ncbi:MAG TPA: phosphoribosyltransferase family protein [Dehalococcoidales bacterium]|nr:phosphoribosyltransferase family protein [Dehalococcoidales bacterium]
MGKITIKSRNYQLFHDRTEAASLLASELGKFRGLKVVVLGIPRGGVVVAEKIATLLNADLDIVLSRKLRTPGFGELAMGAVSEDGRVFLNNDVLLSMNITNAEVENEKQRQLGEIRRRSNLFRSAKAKVPLANRTVIIVDDGVATGATMQASIWAVSLEKPTRIICALPVGPEETIHELASSVDEIICLRVPPGFEAVGQYYYRFEEITDEDVIGILKNYRAARVIHEN